MCTDLAAVAWGDSVQLLPPGAVAAKLPVWGWIGGVDRGAKTRLAPDKTYPVRLTWTVVSGRAEIYGALVTMPRRLGERAVLNWNLDGPQNQHRSGQVSVQALDARSDPTVSPTDQSDLPQETMIVTPQTRSKALRWRSWTQGAGETALWGWVSTVERMALRALSSKAKQLSAEHGAAILAIMDGERRTQMAFDAATRSGWAAAKARKLIDTSSITGRVDPHRYTVMAVHSRVGSDILRLIGDVRQGGQIRSIHAAGNFNSSAALFAAVRSGVPGIGAKSVTAAVTLRTRLALGVADRDDVA